MTAFTFGLVSGIIIGLVLGWVLFGPSEEDTNQQPRVGCFPES